MKSVMKTLVAAGLLSATVVSTAYAIPCPSASDVKGAVRALNGVIRQSPSSYIVLTAQPAISDANADWLLMSQAQGRDFDSGFADGERSVSSVISPVTPDAIEMQGMFVCAYMTSSGGMGVMAAAPQQQGVKLDPIKLTSLQYPA